MQVQAARQVQRKKKMMMRTAVKLWNMLNVGTHTCTYVDTYIHSYIHTSHAGSSSETSTAKKEDDNEDSSKIMEHVECWHPQEREYLKWMLPYMCMLAGLEPTSEVQTHTEIVDVCTVYACWRDSNLHLRYRLIQR